ncbi:MAG: hypothetical protein LUC92_04800 [Clostridiales bacterium]|nr:hypothetical protein [Clostridiales bacterium]
MYNTDILTASPSDNSEKLCSASLRYGFENSEGINKKFFAVKKGSINNAENSGELNALFAACMLASFSYNEHPFFRLARKMPNIITLLSKLEALRNDAVHGNEIEYNFESVKGLHYQNMYMAHILLDNISFNIKDEGRFDTESGEIINLNEIKRLKNAESFVTQKYMPDASRYKTAVKKLAELEKEILAEGNCYPLRVSAVLEALFKHLCSKRLTAEAASSVKSYNDKEAAQNYLLMMQKDGFNVSKLPYYDLRKLSDTFVNYNKGTLNTLFYCWYFSEKNREDSLLPETAAAVPELINVINSTSVLRAHNGYIDYNSKKLDYLKNNAEAVIKGLICLMAEKKL